MIRHRYFGKKPSRLSAVFAFADYDSCQKVAEKHHWDVTTARRFQLSPDSLNRIHRANMEIVSLATLAYRNGMLPHDCMLQLWSNYWNGEGNIKMSIPSVTMKERGIAHELYESGEIWEYLIEGTLQLCDSENR